MRNVTVREVFRITKENFKEYEGKWLMRRGLFPSDAPIKALRSEENDRFKSLVIGVHYPDFERDEFFGREFSLATEEDFKKLIEDRINDRYYKEAVEEYKTARRNLRRELKSRREAVHAMINAFNKFKGEQDGENA